jgi:hypothetical protein
MCLWLSHKKKIWKKIFCGILKVTEERSRIRIRTKKSRIPNTGCLLISGRGTGVRGAAGGHAAHDGQAHAAATAALQELSLPNQQATQPR